MSSVCKVILIGNLGRDPEIRATQAGKEIATLNIATSESWKDRSTGERKERTEWHKVVIMNDALSRVARDYLKKGSKVYVEGQLQTRKWTDQQGVEKYSTEIVLQQYNGNLTILDSARTEQPAQSAHNTAKANTYQSQAPLPADLDDEIPF